VRRLALVFLVFALLTGLPGLLGLAGALTDYCRVLGVFFLALFAASCLRSRRVEPGPSGG
jgi:uncharacterized membrane protein YtjA (UPF0391 family)